MYPETFLTTPEKDSLASMTGTSSRTGNGSPRYEVGEVGTEAMPGNAWTTGLQAHSLWSGGNGDNMAIRSCLMLSFCTGVGTRREDTAFAWGDDFFKTKTSRGALPAEAARLVR